MSSKHWLPIVLLRYIIDRKKLISLIVSEALISYRKQSEVRLPQTKRVEDIIEKISKQCPGADEE